MTQQTLSSKTQIRTYQNLINGAYVAPVSGENYTRTSPLTGEDLVQIAWSNQVDADNAIQVARKVFDEGKWSNSAPKNRHDILRKTADLIREKSQAIATTICQEVARPFNMCVMEVLMTADIFDYFAGLSLDIKGEAITQEGNIIGMTVNEPVGVVGIITPWNFPLVLVAWKIAPAIATGCTMVIKPSEFTPSSTFMLVEILAEAGLPPGIANIVTGDGAVVGERLVESPLVDKIAFTGSTAVGKNIMAKAAPTLKRISLELGGKSPNIIFPDADLPQAIMGAIGGIYLNSGQVCQAGSRLLIHESIKDAVVEQLVGASQTLAIGNPMDVNTFMGPVINQRQFERVQSYIQAGIDEGAKLITGGVGQHSVPGFPDGLFIKPTIFDDVSSTMKIAQEEIFGPVLAVMTFRDEAEALAIANDSMYGLTAGIWTKNIDTAFRMAKGIRAGTIWINTYHTSGLEPRMPYGGFKQSGIGREVGHKGLEEYLETKSVHIKVG
ncbi:aldehyde dehydrogenase family protein [Calothrix sp. 336/3]|uniref:aldehyde dehydrogenase family protein n=1 Tax=Calothrix sp. 336/3 TaxID=1337936 RepID=UPI0004E3F9D0|nr:aldehyde dehydrogenase family protein [Calothrix sp. 336/3]AKG23024.1 hypothetical protein IJ00_18675 [Calothrix sp. 336/3]